MRWKDSDSVNLNRIEVSMEEAVKALQRTAVACEEVVAILERREERSQGRNDLKW